MKVLVRFLLLAMAMLMVGCGGSGAADDNDTSASGGGDNAAAECSPEGDSISITAVTGATNAFDKDCLAVEAGQATTLEFDNPDNEPHNVSVFVEQGGENLFRGEIINPEQSTTYSLPAMEAGEYYFQCDVHPEMNGTFEVAA
jgi:plastocyanin